MSIEFPATRREFLSHTAAGVVFYALAHLLSRDGLLAAEGPPKPGEKPEIPDEIKELIEKLRERLPELPGAKK